MTLILYVFSFVMGGMPLGRPFPSFAVMGCLWGGPLFVTLLHYWLP